MEHRYFGESTPEPRNWHYLNAEQAAADLHAVREALREIYPEKWVATGVSKGGENSLIYRMYYPEDVDVTVAYVGPVCFGVEDGRHEPFLDRVGTDEERATIREFQTEVLKRRKELVPLFDEYCKSKSYTFRTNIDEVFDLCVLEYPFSIWQWGTATSLIPAPDSPHQELLDHLIAIVSPDYFAVNDEPSFFVQAQRELGYYGYDTAPFEGLLSIRDARGYLPRIMLPDDARNIRFSDGLSRRIVSFYKANDPKVICIYGENDPWSAAMPDSTLFEGKANMKLFVERGVAFRDLTNRKPTPPRATAATTRARCTPSVTKVQSGLRRCPTATRMHYVWCSICLMSLRPMQRVVATVFSCVASRNKQDTPLSEHAKFLNPKG